jgi:DNA-binding transcriptional MocR family regulator
MLDHLPSPALRRRAWYRDAVTITHQLGTHPQTAATTACIDLGLGHPSPSLLPAAELARLAGERIGRERLLLQYGTVRGELGFREALAGFLRAAGLGPVSAEQLLVTGGTSTALAIASQTLARPGQRVLCSDPTYFLARGIFEAHGLEVVGVPVDSGGLRVDALAEELRRDPDRTALIYCMPGFHNPCGVTMSSRRRARLVELADRYDAVILADEPYNLLAYEGSPPESLFFEDRGRGRVVSLGSFSKILAPGVRLGWLQASEALLARISGHGALQSGGGLNPVIAATVHGAIESGFQLEHLLRLRQRYTQTSRALVRAVRRRLPRAIFDEPTGGYFAWIDLGSDVSTSAMLGRARAAGVGYTPGERCAVTGDFDRFVRLCFSFYEVAEIDRAVELLADVAAESA